MTRRITKQEASIRPIVWHHCYDGSWKGLITYESFAHPAKMAKGLLDRIIMHGLVRGYWHEGDMIGDPFGGIGSTGLLCSYHGLRSVSVELELRFQRMATGYDCPGLTKHEWVRWVGRYNHNPMLCPHCQDHAQELYERHSGLIPQQEPHRYVGNFDLHQKTWRLMGDPLPVLVQGDSRRFAAIVGQVCGAVTSPPYADGLGHGDGLVDCQLYREKGLKSQAVDQYGSTPGQIGRLPAGQLDAAISSPPYAESIKGDHGERETAAETTAKRNTPGGSLGQSQRHGGYGASAGNIGNLKEGSIEGAIASPPYAETGRGGPDYRPDRCEGSPAPKLTRDSYGQTAGQIGNLSGGSVDACLTSPGYGGSEHTKASTGIAEQARKGRTSGNNNGGYEAKGNVSGMTGETYWSAMRQVYEQVRLALKPGGVLAVVVKGYIKRGQYVDLPEDTLTLLQALGFLPLERIHAVLVKETLENTLFEGKATKTKSRKSFFRRLCESKGAPKIDWEEVLFVQAPATAENHQSSIIDHRSKPVPATGEASS